jgi:hypothetical protein
MRAFIFTLAVRQSLNLRGVMIFSCAVLITALAPVSALAFIATISNSPASLYLQVGIGNVSGNTFAAGGIPGNNATINRVTATVPAAILGAGAVDMTTDSPITRSPYDDFPFCAIPSQVYVGGFFRSGNNTASNATLAATAPVALVNATGDTIAFNTISWVSGGSGDATPTIPSGAFTGATQNLLSITRNNWFESCLRFTYANNQLVPAGTFNGRVRYTLTAP